MKSSELRDVSATGCGRAEGSDLALLLGRARDGDPVAWRALYAQHFEFVYRTGQKLGTPAAEIEDVVQEVFIVAFRKLGDFHEGKLTTWLYRICANIVSDRHRRRRRRRALDRVRAWVHPFPAPSPEQQAVVTDARRAVQRILERMPAKKREVLALYEIDGLSSEEIAALVGCPPGTVRTRLLHARAEFLKHARRERLLDPEVRL